MTVTGPMLLSHLLLAGLGAGLLAALALALRLVVRRDAVLRYRVMVVALLAGSALVPLQLLIAQRETRPGASVSSELALTRPTVREHSHPVRSALIAPGSKDAAAPAPETAAEPAARRTTPDRAAAFLAVYMLGAGFVLVSAARGVQAARRILACATPVTDTRVLRLWASLTADMRTPPALLECTQLNAPACRWRAVVVPAPAGELDDETLAASLRHELVHVTRHDGLIAALAVLASAFLWFQPLVWVFARVLRRDREQSCDAIVVRATGRPRAYALALLRFCTPQPATRPAVPLLGFESAQSVRRRITMLNHAAQPTARARRAALLIAGLGALIATSAGHAILTAAADPGSPFPARLAAASDEQLRTPPQPIAAEVRAPEEGRSEVDVYERAVKLQRFREPRGLIEKQAPKDGSWAFFLPGSDSRKDYPEGTWVTDEETILSAQGARIEDNALRSARFRVRMPGGSKLRATFEGSSVRIEPGPGGQDRISLTGGSVRILDENGHVRLHIRADRPDATMTWTRVMNAGQNEFEIAPADAAAGLTAQLDTQTGAPAGERQPPHGAVRWKLVAPNSGGGAVELRKQWIYDLGQLKNPVGC